MSGSTDTDRGRPVTAPIPALTTHDRPIKRRFEILFGRYTLNPLIRVIYRLGLTPPRMALMVAMFRSLESQPVTARVDLTV